MEIRGRRECKDCGTEWSYFETGEASCPTCGSLHSVGIDDERTLHTATPAELDLSPVREAVDSAPIRKLADTAGDLTGEFVRGYGFIDAGELRPLDDTYLAAMELRAVAGELGRRLDVADDEERYFLELLRADGGARPAPSDVPRSLRAARVLAYANAVREYRSDLRTFLERHPDPAVDSDMERLSTHVRRIRALDGDVEPREAERLVAAARGIGRYRSDGDEGALVRARDRLDTLG